MEEKMTGKDNKAVPQPPKNKEEIRIAGIFSAVKQRCKFSCCDVTRVCAKRNLPVEHCKKSVDYEVVVLAIVEHLNVKRIVAQSYINTFHELGYVRICVVKKVRRIVLLS